MTHTRPTKATRSSRSGRRWLRRIGWLALALLAVTCVVMVTFRVVEGRAKAKVAAVLGDVRVERTVGKEKEMEKEKGNEREAGVRMAELELLGGAFAEEGSERRREFDRRLQELSEIFVNSLRRDTGGPCDFRKLLMLLGGDPQDGRSDAEVRAEVYRRLAGVLETLQRLAQDIDRMPWSWGERLRYSEENSQTARAGGMLGWGLSVLSLLTQAECLSGDAATGRSGLVTLQRAYAEVERQPGCSLQREQFHMAHRALQQALDSGLRQGVWSDADLLRFGESLPAEPAWGDVREILEANREELVNQLATEPGLAALRARYEAWWPSGPITRWPADLLSSALMTDSRVRENMDVVLADMDAMIAATAEAPAIFTLPDAVTLPSARLRASLIGLEWDYFAPAWAELHRLSNQLHGAAEIVRGNHELQLSTALELYQRQHGAAPPTIEALRTATPFPVPAAIDGVSYTIENRLGVRAIIQAPGHPRSPFVIQKR